MAGKITSNSKSIQKNIGGGQNPPTSMIRVKNLLFTLISLLTSDYFLIPSSNENNLIYLLSSEWGKIR